MPELRQNLATKEWVIIAKERARRPEDFVKKEEKKIIPEFVEKCPFCPGNEAMCPPDTFSIKDEQGWKVRVIPNKFAALIPEISNDKPNLIGLKRHMPGFGYHEVIIETPKHNLTTALLDISYVKDIILSYRERYLWLSNDPRIDHIIIFKNHGEAAGTSLEHPHSQLVATPVVPSHIRARIEEAMRYYDDHQRCVFCQMIEDEIEEGIRIVAENASFVCFVPYAAFSPFHLWLLPKRHYPQFGDIKDNEIMDLAMILKDVLFRLYFGINNPDFNYVIRSAPTDFTRVNYFHWYLSIVPRISKAAGFELGSGMFINASIPEESGKFLREVKI
ncbi:MAG: galactose-1-phosphate uridylyltransferase [bacterium]